MNIENTNNQTINNDIQAPVKKSIFKKKKIIILVSSILVVLAIATSVGLYLYNQHLHKLYIEARDAAVNIDTFYDGITISGVDISGMTKQQAIDALKEEEAKLTKDIQINIKYNDQTFSYNNDNFEYSFDTQQVVDKAYDYARSGDIEDRYKQILALEEEPFALEISETLSYPNLPQYVTDIAAQINRDPVDASSSGFNPSASGDAMFSFKEARKGVKVNEEELTQSFEALLNSETKQGELGVPITELDYKISSEQLRSKITLLSTFSTTSTNTASGNHNMATALKKINGTILQPGQTFSFNAKTGDSNLASNGYQAANAIKDGVVIQEFGGGICQAATTVYGAALRANLNVTTRYNHSWPSAYVPIGQDAAISYPSANLKFENNTGYPIYIKSYMSGTKLNVMIYGAKSNEWDTIKVVSQKTETIKPGETQLVDDPTLPAGTTKVKKQSRDGYRATGEKVFYKDGVEVKRTSIFKSYYPPITGITLVGTKQAEPAPTPAPSTESTTPQ